MVTDDTLMSGIMMDFHCQHVIHYSPPRTKAIFRMRLSLLYKAMLQLSSELIVIELIVSFDFRKQKCKCTLLFDESWKKQSPLLKEMMERLHMPIDHCVKEIALEQLKVYVC